MKVTGSAHLPFPPERAYDLMQDASALAGAIPGCNSLELTGENEYKLNLKMVLASLSGHFEGKVTLADHDRPKSFRMLVEGSGKIGFVKGEGVLTLTEEDEGTKVAYDGEAQIGGSIASVGQRMVDTTSKLLVKRFFKKLSKIGNGAGDSEED